MDIDHIEPWSRTHRTNFHELQATHPTCNRRKGNCDDADRTATGNRKALDVILDRLRRGELYTTIVKPTRYGKRDLIILAAYQARELGLISGALVFTPAAQATVQFSATRKLLETIRRYDLPPHAFLEGIRQLKSFDEYQPFSNKEFLLAVNMQLCLRTNIKDILTLIAAEQRRTSLPLAIFIDECHFLGEHQRWGEFFRHVSEPAPG